MLKKLSLCIYALILAGVVGWKIEEVSASCRTLGIPVIVHLSRGDFTVFDFPAQIASPRALVLFGSGDGGWSGFEESICQTLQAQGYAVVGIDCNAYAKTDYDLHILQTDFDRIARDAEVRYGDNPPPLIVGGYSMGAAQAIAVGGGPAAPSGLVGLLLVDPCSRGRYGLRISDQADILPTGSGTFAVSDFTQKMKNLQVVQWHADEDSIDSTAWLHSLTARHREFNFPGTGHYYNHDRAGFLRELVESAEWISSPASDKVIATGGMGSK
jgi:hypothetical protein